MTDHIFKIVLNEKGEVTNIFRLPDNLQSMRFIALEDVDKDGNIWAGYNDNIFKLYVNNQTLRAIPVSTRFSFRDNSIITKIVPDKNECGLVRYMDFTDSSETKMWSRFMKTSLLTHYQYHTIM